MRLNLGCGGDVRRGYVNVDFRQTHPDVHQVDLSVFPWPFDESSADEILMLDFLEHFPYADTLKILTECQRIISDHGTVIIQVPDAEHLAHALLGYGPYLCNSCGTSMMLEHRGINFPTCSTCKQSNDLIAEAAMKRLYGGQDFKGNFHFTCFTRKMLIGKAVQAGLEFVCFEEHDHQYKNWNMKAKFKKAGVW